MQVIIAEKPSVAREIAAIVGATNRKDGFIEGNGYAVTWAFGHLVGLAMPQQYGIAGFRRENLPILPSSFILLPRQVREGKEYKADPGVVKQLGILRELFGMAERIIVATDAGREGELIFRYIYSYLECRTPFVRLWISSLTDRAIREGLQHLRPGNEYDNLYLSAKARSEADWIVGINASQALAVAAGRGVWSLGRVQTPTLAIICSRYLENKAFKPATYFRLKPLHGKGGHGVHRPLHGEIRRQGEGGSSLRRGYRRPNGTRRERGAQGGQGTAASLVRPDDTPERGQQPVWFFGRKNARHRPVALREEVHHLSPYRLTLYIGRCGRGDSGTHREHDTLSPFRGIRGQDGYRISPAEAWTTKRSPTTTRCFPPRTSLPNWMPTTASSMRWSRGGCSKPFPGPA